MIDALNIIKYDRTDAEMEELILFLVCVAGKNAMTTSRLLDSFFYTRKFERVSPFQQIRDMDTVTGMLLERLKSANLGCYTRLETAFRQLANSKLDLKNCTLEQLMDIHGVGRKSASCFLAWTREGVRVAMLDTHLLKYLAKIQNDLTKLNELGLLKDADVEIYNDIYGLAIPQSTPSSQRLYDKLETVYLKICDAQKVNPTEFDLEIWKHYAQKGIYANAVT